MSQLKSSSRSENTINASSMADIAFLLLVFFLVTTEISADEGIGVVLPPIFEQDPLSVNDRNVFNVLLNGNNLLMVENEEIALADLRQRCKEFITNNGRDRELSDNPQVAIVSYKGDRGTSYEHYLSVYNELIGAYKDLRNEMTATETRGRIKNFKALDRSSADSVIYERVKQQFPIRLSEAEPTDFLVKKLNYAN